MILKIKSAEKSDGWFIYDNAEEVFFSRHPNISAFFEDSMQGADACNVVAIDERSGCKQGSFFVSQLGQSGDSSPICTEGWFISFMQKGEQSFELWGDTEVYMLNDNGKTIERIF